MCIYAVIGAKSRTVIKSDTAVSGFCALSALPG